MFLSVTLKIRLWTTGAAQDINYSVIKDDKEIFYMTLNKNSIKLVLTIFSKTIKNLKIIKILFEIIFTIKNSKNLFFKFLFLLLKIKENLSLEIKKDEFAF